MPFFDATNKNADTVLEDALRRQDNVTAVVVSDRTIADRAQRIVEQNAKSTWSVVFIPDPDRLGRWPELGGRDAEVCVVFLGRDDRPRVRLKILDAASDTEVLEGFFTAESRR